MIVATPIVLASTIGVAVFTPIVLASTIGVKCPLDIREHGRPYV